MMHKAVLVLVLDRWVLLLVLWKAGVKGGRGVEGCGWLCRAPTAHPPLSATAPRGAALSGVTTASKQDKNSGQNCPWFELPAGKLGAGCQPCCDPRSEALLAVSGLSPGTIFPASFNLRKSVCCLLLAQLL